MSQTWFISGASRGIGFELVKVVASHSHIVFAGARDPSSATALQQLAAENPKIHIVKHEASSETDAAAVAKTISETVDSLDVVVANAAIGTSWTKVNEIDGTTLVEHFKVNTVGPMYLFQALYPLLLKGQTRKFITISSDAASISTLYPVPNTVYGSTKAALNFITRSIHKEHSEEGFIVFPLHPGMVNTEGGLSTARLFGVEKLPMDPAESAEAVFKVIDTATSEQSGRFLSYEGTDLPW
jgi:NAD(P)-dependent dehydrogenase (short-subunit alcohol dehydrogenase family)